MIVHVPASSANLGPGFDALGMALSIHAELGVLDGPAASEPPERARPIDEHHPATVAYRALGGEGALWARSPIPSGRGLGFSGAMRVGGAVLAAAVSRPDGGDGWRERLDEILAVATRLEGHADNVAASLFGGVVATAAGHCVPIPLGLDPAIVVWIPASSTSTDESRRALGGDVLFADAVFNVGRTALLVAALAAGDIDALRAASEDRLHQEARLVRATASRDAMAAAIDAGAWSTWLSGSGPTVAAMCAMADAEELGAAVLAAQHATAGDSVAGSVKVLRIDHQGAVVEGP